MEPGVSGYCECKGGAGGDARAGESECEHELFTCAAMCLQRWGEAQGSGAEDSGKEVSQNGTCDDTDPPSWCSPNHYVALGVRCDLPVLAEAEENEELKRAYKKKSLQFHPDKRGGSTQAFQRIAAAYEVLSDRVRRQAFNEGAGFPREVQGDGTEGLSFKEEIEKKYFPDRFGFEPFGDPHADRKHAAALKRQQLERTRQEMLARGKWSSEL